MPQWVVRTDKKGYLGGHQAVMQIGDWAVTKTLTKGCPQGSEYGPDLWKQAVNPLLREDPPTGTELIAYVDDLALLISGENRVELESCGNELLGRALLWAEPRKLTFSATKSQTHWLKGRLIKPLANLRLGGAKIEPTVEAKYLSVTFDDKEKFSAHLTEKAKSSAALFSQNLVGLK